MSRHCLHKDYEVWYRRMSDVVTRDERSVFVSICMRARWNELEMRKTKREKGENEALKILTRSWRTVKYTLIHNCTIRTATHCQAILLSWHVSRIIVLENRKIRNISKLRHLENLFEEKNDFSVSLREIMFLAKETAVLINFIRVTRYSGRPGYRPGLLNSMTHMSANRSENKRRRRTRPKQLLWEFISGFMWKTLSFLSDHR